MFKTILTILIFLLPYFASSQTADFTFQSDSTILCTPATITFTQNCTGNPIGFVWDFGNGTRGYSDEVSVIYSTAGAFNVKLIAIYDQKTVEVTKTIVINPAVVSSIGYDKSYICKPGVINFIANTNGDIAKYEWDFGDTSGVITSSTNDTAHNYVNFGDYPVTLIATANSGCVGRADLTVKIAKPTILTSTSNVSGCIPATAYFYSTIITPANDFVSSYSWDFGDGSPVSSAVKNTNHLYAATGVYFSSLNIVTNDGCTNTYNFPAFGYGTPPYNHNAYPKKKVICASETAQFVSKATDANRYIWNFGDGILVTVADTLVQHKFTTLGIKKISVTPYYNGCAGTTINFDIEVVGVIARFTGSNTCVNKKTFSFTSTSVGNLSSFLWNFSDSTPNLTTAQVSHNFPDSGQFITSLRVVDSVTGCSDRYAQNIYTADPILINSDSAICKNSATSFSIMNNYVDSLALYIWNVAGQKIGPSLIPSVTVDAGTLGNFNNYVIIVTGSKVCPDTVFLDHPLLVKGPDLAFTAPSPICFNTTTTLTNLSKPFVATDAITLMYWNYGNSKNNDTIYQPVPFQYKKSGKYRVILTAVDNGGCADSLIQFIQVNPNPFLKVIPHLDTLCFGQLDTLIAFSSDSLLWSPTNRISCINCDTVAVNPVVTTQYNIIATTPFNCSVRDSVFIKVFTPFTATTPTSAFYICRDEKVALSVAPKDKIIVWSPAAGLTGTTIFNPVASPSQSTIYKATLTDSVGCFSDSVFINVNVKLSPTVDAGPDKIVPFNSTYSISPVYSNNITNYAWSPSTLLSCDDCPVPTGTAANSATYTIKVTSDSGCVASDIINIYVECKDANLFMPGAFTPNNDNLNDTYYPITRGIKTILRFSIYNRQGKIVHEAKDFPANSKSFGWNGELRGEPQSPGAYVYILEALCELGEKLTKKGSFLLLK